MQELTRFVGEVNMTLSVSVSAEVHSQEIAAKVYDAFFMTINGKVLMFTVATQDDLDALGGDPNVISIRIND
jgi:hypothetical protein